MKYINFANIRSALTCTDILDHEGIAYKRQGANIFFSAPGRDEKTPSCCIGRDKSHFTDFGDVSKSGSVLDLVVELGICNNIREAAEYLAVNYLHGQSTVCVPDIQVSNPSIVATNPARAVLMPDVVVAPLDAYWTRYASGRGIPPEIATKLLCKITYSYSGAKPVSGIGHRNRSGGYVVRCNFANPSQNKKQIGPADITLLSSGDEHILCRVYEGQFDYLSHLVLDPSVASADAIVLNSTNNRGKAYNVLQSYEEVYCYLDRDEAGEMATRDILEACSHASDHSLFFYGYNDLNDYLLKHNAL